MNRLAILLAAAILAAACGRRKEPAESRAAPAPAPPASSGSPVSAPSPVSYSFQSDIPDCLDVTGKGTIQDHNLLLGVIELKTKQITADCGCPSKALLWRSVTLVHDIEVEFTSGDLLAPEPGAAAIERRVVLLGERDYPPSEPLVVHIGCGPTP